MAPTGRRGRVRSTRIHTGERLTNDSVGPVEFPSGGPSYWCLDLDVQPVPDLEFLKEQLTCPTARGI